MLLDKYKKLAANAIIIAIGTFGSKILGFLLIRLYTNPAYIPDFSTKENIEQTAIFLIPVVTFCIADGILRFGMDRDFDNSAVFSTGAMTTMLGATLLALLSPLFNLVPYLDGYGFLMYIFIYTSAFRQLCSQFVRARGLVKLFAFDGIMATLSLLLFNFLFLVVFKLGIQGYFLSLICSDLFSGLFLCVIAKLPRYLSAKAITKKMFKVMLRYCLPLIPTAMMWSITSVSDRLFVTYMAGPEQNALYSVAYKIPNLILLVSTMFIQAWNMSAISENNSSTVARFYTKVFSSYQSVMYIGTAFLLLLIKPLTYVLVDPHKFDSYKFMPMLIMAVLLLCFTQFLGSVYTSTKHTKNSFYTSIIAAGLNILLNILIIPKYGAQGAAFATLASYGACYVVRIFDTRRYIRFKVQHLKSALNFIILFIMTAVAIIEPRGHLIYLGVGVALVTVMNFSAIIATLRQLLQRKKT